MTVRVAFGVIRLFFAFLCFIALISRFLWGLGSATFTAGNFFAYLTIQSNIAFVVVSAIAGVVAMRSQMDPRWLTNLRAIVLSCILVAGLVYALLIQQAGARAFRLDVPWSDIVLHFWLPALALLEWVVAPGRRRAQWTTLSVVLGYPITWGGITLVRGAVVGWYPYFFLDPAQVQTPAEFVFYSGFALAVFLVVSTGVVELTRLRPLSEISFGSQRVIRRRARASASRFR